ncbi:hypothetical protein VNI00_007366 [Paramarasmius palmivorus]|uniref:Uncharacterized protein n=1 Tax=Paramarasmius palmivorus TaxID=297713 RepID=A0AAW0D3G2_9AGAR
MSAIRRDRDALQKLSRSELQVLAHKEGIKANQKSATIIEQLLNKHPRGVPRQATPKLSLKSVLGEGGGSTTQSPVNNAREISESDFEEVTSMLRIPTESPAATGLNPVSPARTKRQPRKAQATNQQLSNPSAEQASNAEATITNVVHDAESFSSTKRTRMSADIADIPEQPPAKKQNTGPGPKEIRFILREMKTSINRIPAYERAIQNMTGVLQEAKEICDTIEKEIDEMCIFRWLVEEDVIKKMKQDQSLVDGTAVLGSDSVQAQDWRAWKEKKASSVDCDR